MTTIQLILVILGGILVVFFLAAAFLPSKKSLERSVIINKPAEEIYNLISNFENYKKWNPWSRREPDARGTLSGTPGKPGHSWTWEGKKIGSGNLTIKTLVPGREVISDLTFFSPRKMIATDIWRFEPLGENETRVIWGHESELGYPVERYFGLMLEKMLGPDFEQGLKNLKELSGDK